MWKIPRRLKGQKLIIACQSKHCNDLVDEEGWGWWPAWEVYNLSEWVWDGRRRQVNSNCSLTSTLK